LFITLEIGVPSSRDGGAKKNEERDKKAEVTLRMQIGVKKIYNNNFLYGADY
jgi:hypothetical protein